MDKKTFAISLAIIIILIGAVILLRRRAVVSADSNLKGLEQATAGNKKYSGVWISPYKAEDGTFQDIWFDGSKTSAAELTALWQLNKANGLTDRETWNKLFNEYQITP